MMSGEGKVVCVTGGSGYIASWLINLLLQSGYSAKATVRDPCDPKKTAHLLSLDGAKERLQLCKADLLEEGSFDSVIDGCEGVFHTASPVNLEASASKEDLIDPAVKGTINVLKSCVKAGCVKRVIFTSSIATAVYNGKAPDPKVTVDETWYSDPKFCEENELWYALGKTLAERAAWDFAKENGIDLITLHPSFVLGPLLQPTINFSVEVLLKILKGETYANAHYRTVDVRDVADAHIKAFENPSANGRYLIAANVTHFSEVMKLIHGQFPNLLLPAKCVNDAMFTPDHELISKEKAKSLGINYMPLEVTLRDTIQNFAERGLLTIYSSYFAK